MAVELNCNSSENIHGRMVVLCDQTLLHRDLIAISLEKFCGYLMIYRNCKTFQPQTYSILKLGICFKFQYLAAWLTTVSLDVCMYNFLRYVNLRMSHIYYFCNHVFKNHQLLEFPVSLTLLSKHVAHVTAMVGVPHSTYFKQHLIKQL